MFTRAIAVAAVAAALLAGLPGPAFADEQGWSVQPAGSSANRSYFVYDAAPGQQIDDVVRITNRASVPQTFAVYGTDAYTTVDGAFDLLPASRRPTDTGAWITLGQRAYTVAAGASLDIPFRLSVPANAGPGDHAGGVIASVVSQQSTGDGARVNVDRRVAARVYLRVAGQARPAVRVETVTVSYDNPPHPFAGSTMTVTYRLHNTGNLRLSGAARLSVTGPFGLGLGRTPDIAVPELLPGASITVTERIAGIAPAGPLTARVVLDPATADGPLASVERSSTLWAVPWTALIAVALVVPAVLWLRRRRRRAAAAQ
ncbi:WxL protein peptidoglycan domain-containing protein [Dactylosporangium sp. CA-233914]|uniref:WxL protein peptidoglycan domain-containing protein n=1 Tax=Dactylosporangium sp. CA-233914 TaxID=3239934 RepID=UPI003D9133AE